MNKNLILTQSSVLEWLDLIWDAKSFTLSIHERRINGARESLENILKLFPDISARQSAENNFDVSSYGGYY